MAASHRPTGSTETRPLWKTFLVFLAPMLLSNILQSMSGTINMEIFYWWCTAIMILIHAGFLAYEMGASRVKNALASGVKNILAFAFIVPKVMICETFSRPYFSVT